MRFGTAIEHLVEAYKYASDKEWIQDKVAWALYQTWKEADRNTEPLGKDINVRSKDCANCEYHDWVVDEHIGFRSICNGIGKCPYKTKPSHRREGASDE